ncbi:SDR family NAD(P)-dependent oxidoreductase [Actibacterium sp. D379-3]
MPRVALITGAARGIGRAIAADLAADHRVVITFLDGKSEAAAFAAAFPDSLTLHADLSDPAAAARVVAETVARFGRIDTLVNNAAVAPLTPFDTQDFTPHSAIFAVNAIAPMALLSAALPHMAPGSAVVNISSINAARPPVSAPAYAASKAALDAITKAAAKDLGPRGIRVNAVAPGLIETHEKPRPADLVAQVIAQTPLRRSGTPDDIARVVRFLASDAAGFVTGEVLTVSGGYGL